MAELIIVTNTFLLSSKFHQDSGIKVENAVIVIDQAENIFPKE